MSRNQKVAIIVALITGICSIISAIIGSYIGKENAVNEVINQATNTINVDIGNIDDLIIAYGKMSSEISALKDENIELVKENESLKSEIFDLEFENKELLKKLNNSSEESIQENELLLDKKNNTSIREITEFYSDGIRHKKDNIIDNIGNSYNGYTYMSASDDFWVESEGSVVYRNNGQYNRFFGRIIINESEKDIVDCGWVKIYGDNTLLFDSGVMGRGVEPVDFDLDILTYNEIKIEFKDGVWSSKNLEYPKCYLVDTFFN